MAGYGWTLNNGDLVKISFSTNFDNQITKYRRSKVVEGAWIMDCGIVYYMPLIMRYCLEEDVNLRTIALDLPEGFDSEQIDKSSLVVGFRTPLRENGGLIRKINRELVICSSDLHGRVLFNKVDVPGFVEGILKSFNGTPLDLARIKCLQVIQSYHNYLDRGILR
jgi:hypothetical protein